MTTIEFIAGLMGSSMLGGLVTGIFGRRRHKSEATKFDADAAKVIAETSVYLVSPLRNQVADLSTRVTHLEQENTGQKNLLRIATDYIAELRDWIYQNVQDHHPPAVPEALKNGD